MKVLNSILFIAAMVLMYSCKEEHKVSGDSAIKYKYYNLENTGWKSKTHTQYIENLNYTATEVPLAYYILKDKGNKNLSNVDSIYKANERERIIEFEFLQDEEKDILQKEYTNMDYESTIKYISFNIYKDFYLVTAQHDTIMCSGATYERSFKLTPQQHILLFFSGIDTKEDVQLVYNDKLFGKGVLKFKFNEKLTKLLL